MYIHTLEAAIFVSRKLFSGKFVVKFDPSIEAEVSIVESAECSFFVLYICSLATFFLSISLLDRNVIFNDCE